MIKFKTTKNLTFNFLKKNYPEYYDEMFKFVVEDVFISEKVWLFQNNLSETPICSYCSNKVKFIKFSKGYRKFCCKACAAKYTHNDINIKESRISKMLLCNYDTGIRKMMTDKANQTKSEFSHDKIVEINKKRNVTVLQKYGVDFISQSEDIKSKIKSTSIEKYNVDNPMKSNIVREKYKKTILEKYGEVHFSKTKEFHDIMLTSFNITKDKNYLRSVGDGLYEFKCDKGHNYKINSDNYRYRVKNNILCTICYPIDEQKSIKEKKLLELIKSIYSGEIISSYRDVLEIDIYLPELKIGFEFNGLYWHSNKFKDKNYHLNKTNYFKQKCIRIIHIWEDDWLNNNEIIESQIKNLLGFSDKIFARNCVVKEVSIKDSKMFLDDNHIQGSVSSQYKIGLYYTVTQSNGVTNDELVSLMTFNSSEGRKKMEQGGYNLNRFCNKCGVNVVGGASKLLSYFIKTYNPSRIVSYADKDWSLGNLYEVLGFTNVGGNGPDYKYIVDGCRVHKSRYKKSKLNTTLTEAKQMEKDGFLKIYDCGKLKYEYKI
jgi:hypothetical protein